MCLCWHTCFLVPTLLYFFITFLLVTSGEVKDRDQSKNIGGIFSFAALVCEFFLLCCSRIFILPLWSEKRIYLCLFLTVGVSFCENVGTVRLWTIFLNYFLHLLLVKK